MIPGWASQLLQATLGSVMRTLQERIVLISLLLSLVCAVQVGSAHSSRFALVPCALSPPRLTVSRPLCRCLRCPSGTTGAVCCRGPSAPCCGGGTAWSPWAPAAGSTPSAELNTAGTESIMTFQVFQDFQDPGSIPLEICCVQWSKAAPPSSCRKKVCSFFLSRWWGGTGVQMGPCRHQNGTFWSSELAWVYFLKALTCRDWLSSVQLV